MRLYEYPLYLHITLGTLALVRYHNPVPDR